MSKTLRELYETVEIKDNYYVENNIMLDDDQEALSQDHQLSTIRPEFLSLLEEKLDNFSYWLNKIAKEGEPTRNLDKLDVINLWVSKIYVDDNNEVNKGKLFLDKYMPSFIKRNKLITHFSSLISYIDFPGLYGSGIIENSSNISSKSMLSRYDICYNQIFPMFNILGSYRKMANTTSPIIEYISKNVKAIADNNRLRFLVIDIDSETRQNLVFTIASTMAHNIKIVESDYVQMYLDNPKKTMKIRPRVVFTSKEDLDKHIRATAKQPEGKAYSVIREDTGEIVPNCIMYYAGGEIFTDCRNYSSFVIDRWSELFVKEYIHRFGDIMIEDLNNKDNKGSDFNKYGWFATNNVAEWNRDNDEKIAVYNINFYRYIIYKLSKSSIELSDTEWRLVDEKCITFDNLAYIIQGSIYARLDNGHRVIAIGFSYENKDNYELKVRQFGNDNIAFLNEYVNTKFEISPESLLSNQSRILKDCEDTKLIRLYDTEQELKSALEYIDSIMLNRPMIIISFYSQLYDKYAMIEIAFNESVNTMLRKLYPFFKFSYPLCVEEIGLGLSTDSEKKANKLITTIEYDFMENILVLMLNNLAIELKNNNVSRIIIPDELDNECNIHVIVNDKIIDIVEKSKILKVLGTKDNEVELKKIGYKICQYDSDTDMILTRNIINPEDNSLCVSRISESTIAFFEDDLTDNTVLQLITEQDKQHEVLIHHYEELNPDDGVIAQV